MQSDFSCNSVPKATVVGHKTQQRRIRGTPTTAKKNQQGFKFIFSINKYKYYYLETCNYYLIHFKFCASVF